MSDYCKLTSQHLDKQLQQQNKLFNSPPTFIWETRKGEHRFPDRG